ncbi:ABC transporter permease [Streptomyces canus]|uniref:ABC transporter permease n=1 Tax=Streptomyces canus TaxID=58343 RepID=UPI00370FA927
MKGISTGNLVKTARPAVRWVLGPVLTIVAASLLLFLAVAAQPGDPTTQILGNRARPEQYAALRHQLGLDRPLLVQYWHWLTDALTGSFGTSLTFKQNVSMLLWPRLEITLGLTVYAALMIVVFGVTLGVLGGVKRRLGTLVAALGGLGVAVPGFVAAQLLIAVFAVKLGWFPVLGAGTGFTDRITHLTLPAAALAIGSTAYVAQVSRAAVTDVAGRPFVETARGRGLPGHVVLRRHILRNAAIPIATVSGLAVAGLFAGAVVIELAFGLGGLGSLLVQSVSAKDRDVVLAIGLILVVIFVATTTLLDLARHLLDPRLRKGTR